MAKSAWRSYLDEFHRDKAGITGEVLEPAKNSDGLNPYEWLANVLPSSEPVLFVGGDNGNAELAADLVVAVDLSMGELTHPDFAITNRAQANATALPFGDDTFSAVALPMSLMLMQPIDQALSECARVLKPGGALVATMPASTPLSVGDAIKYTGLLANLRTTALRYPNDDALKDSDELFHRCGFALHADESQRFALPLAGGTAERFVQSLYLPDVDDAEVRRATTGARRWNGEIGIPIRRLVATRRGQESG